MSEEKKPNVIVCQHGARHRYAIPKMFEKAGILEALYTDSCEYSFLGKLTKTMGPLAKGSLKRLANRKIPSIPRNKILSTDMPTYKLIISQKGKSKINDYLLIHESMNDQLIKFGTRNANILYCFEGENLGFIKYAKQKGLMIILDVISSPITERITSIERAKFNSSKNNNSYYNNYDVFREKYFCSQADLSDILLCPSKWVAQGIKDICPKESYKIHICPYGSSIDFHDRVNKPIKGRFFWAGGDWIRKGLHYLAKAADILKLKYPEMEFRAAGINDPKVIKMERFKNITFLGKLNKQQMQDEFLSADAFVFPTLSEGMAGVVIEAIAAGCPVITTKCSGVDAYIDAKQNIIISPFDSQAILKAILKIYKYHDFRNNLIKNSYYISENYSLKNWNKRLIDIVMKLNIIF